MNTKRFTFIAAGALMLAQLACGGGAASPTAAPTNPPQPTEPPAPTATAVPLVELGEEYRVDEGGYSFSTVPNYAVTGFGGIAQMGPEGSDPDTGPSIFFVGGPNDQNLTLDNGFEVFSSTFDSSNVTGTQDTSVGSLDARITDFTGVSAGKDVAGRFLVAVSEDATYGFAMVAVAPPDQWADLETYFTPVHESIRLFTPVSSSAVGSGETIRQWGSGAVASSEFGSISWTAMQATGAPDTFACGDHGSAWASASSGGKDWIEVYYDTPVIPSQVNIYQSYNPSSVTKVELLGTDGAAHVVFDGDPFAITDPCPYVLTVSTAIGFEVQGVRVTIDQSVIGGWNEIDAVELVGETTTTAGGSTHVVITDSSSFEQFASSALASSQYGDEGWSAKQATGEPNVGDACGDDVFAWASKGTGEEWLEVYFDTPVVATELHIFQNYNPNQIVLIEAIDERGQYSEIFAGAPGGVSDCPTALVVPVFKDFKIQGVRITVDQSRVNSWNEIDAVKLVGTP